MAFDKQALQEIQDQAEELGVEWQALAAVATVESGGRPLWDNLCPIRIEGHYFYDRLAGQERKDAVAQGLASPNAGAVKNPAKMADRYAMLQKMEKINRPAARESCSWGLGQVMGAHWDALGYSNVDGLMAESLSSVSGQIRLMCRFIENFGLLDALRKKDWARFAKRYNGSGYAKNKYDNKMEDAYRKFLESNVSSSTAAETADAIIERGDTGAQVKSLQQKLDKAGYYKGAIDGIFGGGTEIAVMDFQRDLHLQIDGRAGPNTLAKLDEWKPGMQAVTGGIADVVYKNQHATRNRPCTANLEAKLATAVFAVYGAGMQAQIYSGGQPMLGTPGKRTGSIRHDDYGSGGRALDAWIIDSTGKRLSGTELAKLGQFWLASGYGGCGLEMQTGGIHLDEWVTPPKGGAMYWLYPYAEKQSWGKIVKQMLIDGAMGKMPNIGTDGIKFG